MKTILLTITVVICLFILLDGNISSYHAEEYDHDCLSCCGVCQCSCILQESGIIPFFNSNEVVSVEKTTNQCIFIFEIDHPPKVSS